MRIIINDIEEIDGLPILALRAGMKGVDKEVGYLGLVEFEDGSLYSLKRNKQSVSVWLQK